MPSFGDRPHDFGGVENNDDPESRIGFGDADVDVFADQHCVEPDVVIAFGGA